MSDVWSATAAGDGVALALDANPRMVIKKAAARRVVFAMSLLFLATGGGKRR